MYQEYLNENETLEKITRYELNRSTGRLYIDIHEMISATIETKEKFLAIPNLITYTTKDEYLCYGNSESEALSKCLCKIQNVDFSDLNINSED